MKKKSRHSNGFKRLFGNFFRKDKTSESKPKSEKKETVLSKEKQRELSLRQKQRELFFLVAYYENQDHLDNVSYILKQ